MPRKFIAGLLLSVTALTPSAALAVTAQDCAAINGVVQSAGVLFSDIPKGAYDSDLEEYAAEIRFDGASECYIEEDEYSSQYGCIWWFDNNENVDLDGQFDQFHQFLKACFKLKGAISGLRAVREDRSDSGTVIFRSSNTLLAVDEDDTSTRITFRLRKNVTKRGTKLISLNVEQDRSAF